MKKMAGVLVGAVGIAAFVASPAHAVEWPSWPGEVENSAGDEGNFQSDGDWVGTLDWRFDGKSAVTRWETDYGRSGACVDSNGAQNGETACNYDMAETGYIRIMVCEKDLSAGGGYTTCSAWSQWLSISDGVPK
ncbi:hypothetical protein OG558_22160 [Kribbella sp. NBC_01510]|uniref:hypothetical protein n=1 Tax=unclassified Kribbella TaxID=2644121 RepID=UPI002E353A0D|nr:hypothetical protein [Kribbella sp. NBC_01484]